MNDLKIRIMALAFAIILFLCALLYSSCDRQGVELIQTEVALTEDGVRVVYYVDEQGNEYVRYGDSEIILIGDD